MNRFPAGFYHDRIHAQTHRRLDGNGIPDDTANALPRRQLKLLRRFRLIVQDVDCKKVEKPMPMLPTGTVFWTPRPDLKIGTTAWIYAGGAHHTAMSYDLTSGQMADWAEAMGIECVVIDADTKLRDFQRDLKLGEVFYR